MIDRKIWLFDLCEELARFSGKSQCAKCGVAFRFSFLRVGKKTKSFFFHCHFIFHSQTILSVIFSDAVFFFALLVTFRSYTQAGFLSLNYLRINIFLFLLSYPASTETQLAGRCCYGLGFSVFQFKKVLPILLNQFGIFNL